MLWSAQASLSFGLLDLFGWSWSCGDNWGNNSGLTQKCPKGAGSNTCHKEWLGLLSSKKCVAEQSLVPYCLGPKVIATSTERLEIASCTVYNTDYRIVFSHHEYVPIVPELARSLKKENASKALIITEPTRSHWPMKSLVLGMIKKYLAWSRSSFIFVSDVSPLRPQRWVILAVQASLVRAVLYPSLMSLEWPKSDSLISSKPRREFFWSWPKIPNISLKNDDQALLGYMSTTGSPWASIANNLKHLKA